MVRTIPRHPVYGQRSWRVILRTGTERVVYGTDILRDMDYIIIRDGDKEVFVRIRQKLRSVIDQVTGEVFFPASGEVIGKGPNDWQKGPQ